MLTTLLREHAADAPRLIECIERIGNGAAFKRLGFMLETRRSGQAALIDACRGRLTCGYVKLDPRLPADRLITAWRLWVPPPAKGGARWLCRVVRAG